MSDDFSDDFRKHGHVGGGENAAVEQPPAELAAIYDRLVRDSDGWARRLPAVTPLQEYLRALSVVEVRGDVAASPSSGAVAVRHEQFDFSEEPPMGAAPGGQRILPSAHLGRRAVWGGTLSAVAVVALLAAMFVLLPRAHDITRRTASTASTSPHASSCPPDQITVMIPAHTRLYQLDMTSPTDGWALGRTGFQVVSPAQTHSPVLVQFHQCRWAPVPTPLTGKVASLNNISMDTVADGWAAGSETIGTSFRCVLLHFTAGKWQRAAVPPQLQGQRPSSCDQIRMYAPDEGWLLASWGAPGDAGTAPDRLLHYVNGVWTLVESPISGLFDVETTGPGDVWVAGLRLPAPTDPNRWDMVDLAHDVQGHWTTFHLSVPADAWVQMNSPSDGWLVSATAPPEVMHYDGNSWQQASFSNMLTANSGITVFDASDIWTTTYELVQSPSYARITRMQHYVDGKWKTVTWPFPDDAVSMPLTRTAPGDYWAVGIYVDGTDLSTWKGVLLQYAGGAWHEYGA